MMHDAYASSAHQRRHVPKIYPNQEMLHIYAPPTPNVPPARFNQHKRPSDPKPLLGFQESPPHLRFLSFLQPPLGCNPPAVVFTACYQLHTRHRLGHSAWNSAISTRNLGHPEPPPIPKAQIGTEPDLTLP